MNISKIAIVKLSAMGDIVHCMVALEYIKKKFPNIKIDWIVENSFSKLLQYNPNITNVYKVNLKSIKKNLFNIFRQIKLIRDISKNSYDLVIDAQGLIKSAIVCRLLGKNVAGFNKDCIRESLASYFYSKKYDIPYHINTIDRNSKILSYPLGFDINSSDILNKNTFLFYKNEDKIIYDFLSNSKKNILFIISSTWESRNYPKEKFINIANILKENILVVYSNNSEKQKAIFMSQKSKYIKVVPKLDINTLKALISKCDLIIGNDTGPTHMAWGFNIPSICIFGCTPISRVYKTAINKTIKSYSKVDPYKLNKNDFSITSIKESDIISLVQEVLK